MNLDKYKKGWAYHRAKRRISEAQNTPEQITLFDIEERSNTDRMADRGRTSGGVWEMKKEQVNERD